MGPKRNRGLSFPWTRFPDREFPGVIYETSPEAWFLLDAEEVYAWFTDGHVRLISKPGDPMRSAMDVERTFTYHSPTPDQLPRYQALRSEAKALAFEIMAHCPDSPERTIALRKLQEAIMFANASIAINEVVT